MLTSIDVKFIFHSARLGSLSAENIPQTANVALELSSCCSCHVFSYCAA